MIDAPDGYSIQDRPGPSGRVIRTVPGPASIKARFYTDIDHVRYYVDDEFSNAVFGSKRMPHCYVVPDSNRSRFLAKCRKPVLIKKAKKESIYGGEVLASFFEQVVPLESTVSWGASYQRGEIDFLAPVKVMSFTSPDGNAWELKVRVFPSFDSQFISPQDAPKHGDPDRWSLTIKPDLEEVTLKGSANGRRMGSVFLPDTVWVGGFSEGRLQHLRIGDTDLPPSISVSKLSEPLFASDEKMSFRFSVQRLLAGSVELALTPDLITGADINDYRVLSRLGKAPSDSDYWGFEPGFWNIVVRSDQTVTVVAPIFSERGAPGALELESLDLGPNYQEDLAALVTFGGQPIPAMPKGAPGWSPISSSALGEIPVVQRAPERIPY